MAADRAPTESTPPRATSAASTNQRGAWILRRLLPVGMFLLAGALLIFALGVAQRLGWLKPPDQSATAATADSGVVYTCAMHPQIRQPTPGRCPICGMALVPASNG